MNGELQKLQRIGGGEVMTILSINLKLDKWLSFQRNAINPRKNRNQESYPQQRNQINNF